jgi:hypothetical protein
MAATRRKYSREFKVERRTLIGDTWRFEETLRDSEDSSKLNTSFVERLEPHDPTGLGLSFSSDDLPSALEGASRRSRGVASLMWRPHEDYYRHSSPGGDSKDT